MLLEVYARIKDFEQYAISNYGEVINIKTGRQMKIGTDKKGYSVVDFSINSKKKRFKIHRLVGLAFLDNNNNIDNKTLIDHKDNNKKNNCLLNLRWANHFENNRNRKISSVNNTGVKGVSYLKDKKKWRAQITYNKKMIHIGYYEDIESAKIARQSKALELYGEFLNECEK